MKSLTVKVSDPVYRALDRFLRRNGQTKDGLINALLEAFFHGPRGVSGTQLTGTHPFWKLIGAVRDRAGVSENVNASLHGRRKKA